MDLRYTPMIMPPREIILIAASNYLDTSQRAALENDLLRYKRLTDVLFLRCLQRYFDVRLFKDKPYVPEDILLFNYLMYENRKPDAFNPLDTGEIVRLKGKFCRSGSVARYERLVIKPQLLLIREANQILKK